VLATLADAAAPARARLDSNATWPETIAIARAGNSRRIRNAVRYGGMPRGRLWGL